MISLCAARGTCACRRAGDGEESRKSKDAVGGEVERIPLRMKIMHKGAPRAEARAVAFPRFEHGANLVAEAHLVSIMPQ